MKKQHFRLYDGRGPKDEIPSVADDAVQAADGNGNQVLSVADSSAAAKK
ncbi:hypothetical protein BN1221_02055c [Brenneria goodwinii]|uniref:Uncharacterized protein n=1 Tax=Brenneria goodwinii TaxID=1109412 RepID=A0A0G4JV99_9GAMM|nr:hypothetical protein BN1221_02055c [Brenneria goodwinii]